MIDLSLLEPVKFERAAKPEILDSSTAAGRKTLLMPAGCSMVGSTLVVKETAYELNIDNPDLWDDAQYATPANRVGKDFYLYCLATGSIIFSANSTVPNGFTADDSRKVDGFHTMCVDIGSTTTNSYAGFLLGDIMPDTIWDLKHRPSCSPEGMFYSPEANLWCDMYLMSQSGAATESVYGGTITVSRTWLDCVDDLAAVGKRMLFDAEFQIASTYSNQETNIAGSAFPATTGGHFDTAGKAMISNRGGWDFCGLVWQWLGDQSFRIDGLPATGDPTWAYYDLPGSKGSLYKQGTNGDVKLLAGGGWSYGSNCGSRARLANSARWSAGSSIGCRGCAASQGA